MTRHRYAVLLAIPPVVLAIAGLFHPHHLDYATSQRWYALHIPGLLVFPLVGVSLMLLVRGRTDPIAWVVRVAAYVYATCYSALDILSGIGTGYVLHRSGSDAARPEAVHYLFVIGEPFGKVGALALIAGCALVVVERMVRRGVDLHVLLGILAILGAVLVYRGHIFAPEGVIGMVLIAVGFAALVPELDRHGEAKAETSTPSGATG